MDFRERPGPDPVGDAFNAISLHKTTGRPLNPMINAGAIATTGQIRAHTPEQRIARILEMFARYTTRPMQIDRAVYESESRTGHRNRAIGHLLRNFDILEDDPMAAVDGYFQQCSISVRCVDLALMGATLANQGVNPISGERAIQDAHVESVLSVMASCGMYDFSGGWIYKVGMPAKSGVAGGVLAVLSGQLGIGVFSPRLDEQGNSVRVLGVCEELSRIWQLHQFNPPYERAGGRVAGGTGGREPRDGRSLWPVWWCSWPRAAPQAGPWTVVRSVGSPSPAAWGCATATRRKDSSITSDSIWSAVSASNSASSYRSVRLRRPAQ